MASEAKFKASTQGESVDGGCHRFTAQLKSAKCGSSPLSQPGLWKLPSLRQAADEAVRMLTDFAFDPAIKVPLDDD